MTKILILLTIVALCFSEEKPLNENIKKISDQWELKTEIIDSSMLSDMLKLKTSQKFLLVNALRIQMGNGYFDINAMLEFNDGTKVTIKISAAGDTKVGESSLTFLNFSKYDKYNTEDVKKVQITGGIVK